MVMYGFLVKKSIYRKLFHINQNIKVHGANTGPTWVLSAPGGPHIGPMNLVIGESTGETHNPHDCVHWLSDVVFDMQLRSNHIRDPL